MPGVPGIADRPDPLPREFAEAFDALRSQFGRLATRTLFYHSTGSTNDVASALAAEENGESEGRVSDARSNDGAVVIADSQTAGRGRRGRTWFSPPGAGLYVSLLLNPAKSATDPARATSLLTLAAGVALAEGVEAATGLRPDIKWPNDLLVGRRKLAGILAEGIAGSAGPRDAAATNATPGSVKVVLGFGINISPAAYPPDVAQRATSLETELGRPVDRGLVCAHAIAALARRYDDLLAGRFEGVLDDWRHRAPGSRGARVRWQDPQGPQTGITAGLDDTGALVVQVGESLQRLVAGEVLWD